MSEEEYEYVVNFWCEENPDTRIAYAICNYLYDTNRFRHEVELHPNQEIKQTTESASKKGLTFSFIKKAYNRLCFKIIPI